MNVKPVSYMRRCGMDASNVWNGMLFLHGMMHVNSPAWYAAEFLEPMNDEGRALLQQCYFTADDKWRRPNEPYSSNPALYKQRRLVLDRAEWPPGAWMHEPDLLDWRYRGRHMHMRRAYDGCWGAFAAYDPLGALRHVTVLRANTLFSAHGGIRQVNETLIGFECGTIGDMGPGMPPGTLGQYRDVRFVKRQVEHLGDQIINYEQAKALKLP